MRPYVANDLTNLKYRLLTPAYKQPYEDLIDLAYKRLIMRRNKETIPLIFSETQDFKGPNIQKAIFNSYEPAIIELNPEDSKATKVAANFVNRNAGTFLKQRGNKDSIQNAFESYERKWHVSSNFIHMCGFYFDGGPAEARE